jgi:hypothetical protein
MVQPENIDSGHSNFQLDTRSGGYYRNLDYLLVDLALKVGDRVKRRDFITLVGDQRTYLAFEARSPWAISEGCPGLRSDRDRQRSTTGW